MTRFWLWGLASLLLVLPLEVSGKHVIKHRQAAAQTAGCTVGGTPPSTGCGIGDLAVGGALSATDAIAICQQGTGGCKASSPTWQLTQVPLLSSIRGGLSGTAPITYSSTTGAFGLATDSTLSVIGGQLHVAVSGSGITAPNAALVSGNGTVLGGVALGTGLSLSGTFPSQTLTATGGGATTLTLAPGLTSSTTGVYNPGTQTVTNGGTISPQAFYEAHTSSCTLNSTCGSTNDSGKILEATATGVTFTLPSIGAVGSGSYSFSFAGNPYTIAAAANIYGCGPTGTSVSAIDFDAVLVTNGTTWKCFASGMSAKFTASWGPNVDLTKTPIPILTRAAAVQISALTCIPGGLAPSPATVDLCFSPDGTVPNATCNNTGVVKLTNTASCNAAAGSGIRQASLTNITGTTAAGTIWMVGTGAGWQGGGTTLATVSGEIQIATMP